MMFGFIAGPPEPDHIWLCVRSSDGREISQRRVRLWPNDPGAVEHDAKIKAVELVRDAEHHRKFEWDERAHAWKPVAA
jgi:hypothetical protein